MTVLVLEPVGGIAGDMLLAALLLIATFPFLALFGDSTHGWRRNALQAWVLLVAGA